MQHEIVISGFGGQGALFAGQVLAYAAMDEGKHVTWIPSYGPEMRGGTAHCIVIVSDEEIGSPLVRNPGAAIVLNNPSMEKYQPLVKAGGYLLINRSLINLPVTRNGIYAIDIPASDAAVAVGEARLLNVIMLGALIACTAVVSMSAIDHALEAHLPERHRRLLDLNKTALRRGLELARPQLIAAAA
ncbi:MAG TPA: 2-oxoacid:acceptor oxidoreductase family protein [Anaerolineae bacterium]|nr:2-oxoacid:acceptor oxidoreductase family protein [Anaerolineae bacterium]